MDNEQTVCDARRIELFLADQLGADEQAAFERHLDGCQMCRQEMERRAAAPKAWQEVRELLSSHDLEERSSGVTPASRPSSASDSRGTSSGQLDVAGAEGVLESLAPSDDPRMLGRLGAYEISGVVGCGGMGVVLKGFDTALNRYVAIKVLAPHLAASGSARRRFAREAQAAAAVVHENVVEIYGVAEAADLPYFVMPYIRGTSLQKRLDEHGLLAVPEVLRIAMQTAAGLAAAHAQGLVHRDIKPANILLADGVERVKITDFGLARAADDASLTRTGVIAGTPQFMSPEQARGEPVDARSDLFSLGSVMYAMCTGRPPFRAETSYGILRRITDTQPRPIREINPEIPDWLAAIIGKLHAKDPAERFQSADELAKLLEQCLAHVQQPTAVALPEPLQSLLKPSAQLQEIGTPLSPGRLGRVKSILQPPALPAAAILAVLVLLVTIAGITIPRHFSDQEPSTASSPAAAAPASSADADAVNPSGSLPAEWDDGIERKILQLDSQVDDLERRTQRVWENETTDQE